MNRNREFSAASREALGLFALRVRAARRERRMRAAEVAERVGVSLTTVRKVERGDPTVALGTAFEVATIVGVALFGEDRQRRAQEAEYLTTRLTVLPDAVRHPRVDNDF
ncbi:MAG: helix-turn-helix transcriptional regulator [bacterium]|nr:helix-turn-helix transcriptional regulator [bacterium]MXZ30345.1 helix-turn-helix transcriptional regulator [Acidimicrobiia bacterium]MYJ14107.1 helix-turn-helix transcriptional regulator [Acidimicrobiia bacterium]